MITYEHVLSTLRTHIVVELLDGDDQGLDAQTPLLEWGVLNSLEMARLLRLIQSEFGVRVPAARATATHFQTLDRIVQLVLVCAAADPSKETQG